MSTSAIPISAERFSRERLAGYDPDVLACGRVALIGAGALGQNVVLPLALSGVGELATVDFDRFENSNLTRSPFFAPDALKAPAVAHGFLARATAPTPVARAFIGHVQEVGDLLLRWADVVISAVDSDVARAYLAERCRLHRTPLIEAGFYGHDASVSVYLNARDDEPCWRCGREAINDSLERGLCTLYARRAQGQGLVPAVQSVAQLSGAIVAEAAIAALHGELSLASKRWSLNARTGRSVTSILTLDPDCAGTHAGIDQQTATVRTSDLEPVEALLRELERNGEKPVVALPAPFWTHVGCSACPGWLEVHSPAWALARMPVHPPGGCTRVAPASGGYFPSPVVSVGCDEQQVLALSCRDLGLGPGAVFQVTFEERAGWFAMPGLLAEHFIEIGARNGASPARPQLSPLES